MARRWLVPLRMIGRPWLALLIAIICGFFAYYWQTPGPLWQIQLNHRASLRGFSADGQVIYVSQDLDVMRDDFIPHCFSIWTGEETNAGKEAKHFPKTPHELPATPRGIPHDVSVLEIQSEENLSSKLVLGYVNQRDRVPAEVRLYRLYPDSQTSTLIWSQIFTDGGETVINLDQRFNNTIALLELTPNSTDFRDFATGLSLSLQAWHQRFQKRVLSRDMLMLNSRGNHQNQTSLLRTGNVGFTAISPDKKYLFCSFQDAPDLWKLWDWCLLKAKGQPAEWAQLGKRTYAELIEIQTQQGILLLPCPHHGPYNDVPFGCQFAFHPSGNLFALLEENKSYSMLSVWPFPIRRMFLQWIIITAFAITPIVIAAFRSYKRRPATTPDSTSQYTPARASPC